MRVSTRNCAIWPIHLPLNYITDSKGSNFYILFTRRLGPVFKETSDPRRILSSGLDVLMSVSAISFEPPHGKTNNLHRRKQRRNSSSLLE